jgi:co-chaperonin GroES (HSP10)
MIVNESGLRPLGRAVLVRMIELEELKAVTIAIPDSVRRNSAVMEQRAEVVEIGSECWADEKAPRCKAGDKVIITKLAGYVASGPKDKKLYRLCNDRDIFALVEENGNG